MKNEKSKIIIKNSKLERKIRETKKDWEQALDDFKFNEALISVWDLISFCDRFIEKERPWSFDPAQDKEKLKEVISNLLLAIGDIAEMLKPFLPETAEKILTTIKTNKYEKPLFPKI
jgi:methionyl-tRNA synthetase